MEISRSQNRFVKEDQKAEEGKIISRSDWQPLSVLLGVGFLTRMVFYSQIYLISLDGAFQYIPVAKMFAWGEYREAFRQVQLPLYPFLIAGLSKMTGNFEVAGQIISMTASLLAVIPLYLLGKSIFGKTAAFWAGIFYFLNPQMLQRSVDVLKEGLLIFLLFSAVFLFYVFLNRKKIFWLLVSILGTLLASLTRVVSLIFIPVFVSWILFLKKGPFDVGLSKRWVYVFIVLTLSAAMVILIMINVRSGTGQLDISKHGVTIHSLVKSILFDKGAEIGELERGPLPLIKKIVKVYHPVLFLFLLVAFVRRKAIPRDPFREAFLGSFIFAYLIIICLMMWSTQRYLFFPILLSYLWAGVGVLEIQERAMKKLHLSSKKVTLGTFLLIFIIFLPVLSNPYRVEKIGTKTIGFWIRDQEIGRPLILTDIHRVAYYAGGELLTMDRGNYRECIFEAKAKGIRYIVADAKNIKREYPDLMDLAKQDFLLQKIPLLSAKDREKYLVFKSIY